MALDLFKRVETRKGLFAVEKITLIYNLLTSILILFLFQRMDHPWHMLLDRAMIAAMTFLLMYLFSVCAHCYPDESIVLLVSGYFRVQSFLSEFGSCICNCRTVYFQWSACYLVLPYVSTSYSQRGIQYGIFLLLSDDADCGSILFHL